MAWMPDEEEGSVGWREARSGAAATRTLAINAAVWGGQVPLVPELGRVLSSGLIARDQIPCSVQATTEWYEARHDGRFMLNFGLDVKWTGFSGEALMSIIEAPARIIVRRLAPPAEA